MITTPQPTLPKVPTKLPTTISGGNPHYVPSPAELGGMTIQQAMGVPSANVSGLGGIFSQQAMNQQQNPSGDYRVNNVPPGAQEATSEWPGLPPIAQKWGWDPISGQSTINPLWKPGAFDKWTQLDLPNTPTRAPSWEDTVSKLINFDQFMSNWAKSPVNQKIPKMGVGMSAPSSGG